MYMHAVIDFISQGQRPNSDTPTIIQLIELSNAAVTREIKLFETYFSIRRRPSEIFLFQHL